MQVPLPPWHLGDLVKKIREDAFGWTQEQLAKKADLDKGAVTRLEQRGDNYKPETLRKVCAALGTTEATMFAWLQALNGSAPAGALLEISGQTRVRVRKTSRKRKLA